MGNVMVCMIPVYPSLKELCTSTRVIRRRHDPRLRGARGDADELDLDVLRRRPLVQRQIVIVKLRASRVSTTSGFLGGGDHHRFRERVVAVVDVLRNLPDQHGSTLPRSGVTLHNESVIVPVFFEVPQDILETVMDACWTDSIGAVDSHDSTPPRVADNTAVGKAHRVPPTPSALECRLNCFHGSSISFRVGTLHQETG